MGCLTQLCRERERERKANMQIRELTYVFWIEYEFYKGNTKFIEFDSFYCGAMTLLG